MKYYSSVPKRDLQHKLVDVITPSLVGCVLFQKLLKSRGAHPFSGSPWYPEDMLKKKFFASTNTRVVPRPASQYWRPKNEGRQIKLKLKFYYAN